LVGLRVQLLGDQSS